MFKKEVEMFDRKLALFIILGIFFTLLAIKFTFNYTVNCNNFKCFVDKMKVCESARYINDDVEATWEYKIIPDTKEDICQIDVTLLQAKSGDFALDKLEGYDMTCAFQKGAVAYPESDLNKCHGILKEEMQNIIIKKLHSYIIENLKTIDRGLNSLI